MFYGGGAAVVQCLFDNGTLVWNGSDMPVLAAAVPELFKFDERTMNFRSRACDYAKIQLKAQALGVPVDDRAAAFKQISDLNLQETLIPRPHQKTAFEAWRKNSYRGVAALPTGSGKTILAVMAIARLKRSTLVLVPTIDLLTQWANVLEKFFKRPIGMWGGGSSTTEDITVSTYNSAVLKMEFYGNCFACLIADECHHLPGPANRLAAEWAIAPYRLGLSATPESDAERDAVLTDLMGELCCRIQIDELSKGILSDYDVETVELNLTPQEEQAYILNRKIYTDFLRQHHIVMSSVHAWRNFIMEVAKSGWAGKKAFEAYLKQKSIARGGEEKLSMLWQLLCRHAGERIIIFTADNATAYEIGRRYLLPVLTHHTKSAERKNMLENFRVGDCPVLVSSKVLNEGVDVPEANIGIIVSGGAGVREHVQRLGRILRAKPGKKAVLYELVNSSTSELNILTRRREHRAYQTKIRGD